MPLCTLLTTLLIQHITYVGRGSEPSLAVRRFRYRVLRLCHARSAYDSSIFSTSVFASSHVSLFFFAHSIWLLA